MQAPTTRIQLSKIPIDVLSEDSLGLKLENLLELDKKSYVLYANAHTVQLSSTEQTWLVDFYQGADVVLCDGIGIQIGAKLTRQPVPDKIAYNIWFWKFLARIEGKYSIYLIGGTSEVIQETVKRFKEKYPQLVISGYHHGYFDKESSFENEKVLNSVQQVKPDILLVGFGQPVQERWIKNNFDKIDATLILSCGGAFDFFSNKNKVAPYLIRKMGLEWFFRLLLEPKRLFKRYTFGNIRFLILVAKQCFRSN